MLNCPHEYLNKLAISDEDRQRLSDLHNKIIEKAKESKVFQHYDGKLYSYRSNDRQKMAYSFVGKINKEYGTPVAKIVQVPPHRLKLSVNVINLKSKVEPGEQQTLFSPVDKNEPSSRSAVRESYRAVNELFGGERGSTAQTLLSKIGTDNTYRGHLAKEFSKMLHIDVPVYLMTREQAVAFQKESGISEENIKREGYNGMYMPTANVIIIADIPRDAKELQTTVIHEVGHAITFGYLKNNPEVASDLRIFRDKIKEQLTPKEQEIWKYYLNDSVGHEFITVASNPAFISMLSKKPSINVRGKSLWQEMWDYLKELYKKVFGRVLADDYMTVVSNVMHEAAEDLRMDKELLDETNPEAPFEIKEKLDFVKELAEVGEIDLKTSEVYDKMLSLSDEEVNKRIKDCE